LTNFSNIAEKISAVHVAFEIRRDAFRHARASRVRVGTGIRDEVLDGTVCGAPDANAAMRAHDLQRFPIDLIHSVVMRGLDPRIHHLRKSMRKWMDPRVKPAGDGGGRASVDSNRPGTACNGLQLDLRPLKGERTRFTCGGRSLPNGPLRRKVDWLRREALIEAKMTRPSRGGGIHVPR
jgi:hypothetical protein